MNRLLCGLAVLGLLGGLQCQARADSIYWTDYYGGDIRRANLDGSGQAILVKEMSGPTAIALDLGGGMMYWTDADGGDIRRANLDGSGVTVLLSGLAYPSGIALDLAGGNLYYCEVASGLVGRANLDGSAPTILVSGLGSDGPHGMALDTGSGKMYWANVAAGAIQRANLDGSGLESIVVGLGAGKPGGVTLDLAGGKMYWSDWDTGAIWRANLDGSDQEELVTGLSNPGLIALDDLDGQMFWAGGASGTIGQANLDGSGQTTLVNRLNTPWGIALDIAIPTPVQVMGFSADVISDRDPEARFAQPFNGSTFAWFEAGAVDDDGVPHQDGLPAGLTFLSATDSGATYQIQPASASNVLQLSAGQTGTLTLTTPAAYRKLYFLASSGDGTPASVGSGSIHFADGSTQDFRFNTFDWCNAQGGLHPEAILPGPNGRADVGPEGTAFAYNQDCDFQIYETVVAVDPAHAGVAIASIDFTAAPDAVFTNVFGVSGR